VSELISDTLNRASSLLRSDRLRCDDEAWHRLVEVLRAGVQTLEREAADAGGDVNEEELIELVSTFLSAIGRFAHEQGTILMRRGDIDLILRRVCPQYPWC
jgi:hypothetical protein